MSSRGFWIFPVLMILLISDQAYSEIERIIMEMSRKKVEGHTQVKVRTYDPPYRGAWKNVTLTQILADQSLGSKSNDEYMPRRKWEDQVQNLTLKKETHPTTGKVFYVQETTTRGNPRAPSETAPLGLYPASEPGHDNENARGLRGKISDVKGATKGVVSSFNGQCQMDQVHARLSQSENGVTAYVIFGDLFCQLREINTKLKSITDSTVLEKNIRDLDPNRNDRKYQANITKMESDWNSTVSSLPLDEQTHIENNSSNDKRTFARIVGKLLGLIFQRKRSYDSPDWKTSEDQKTRHGLIMSIANIGVKAVASLPLGPLRVYIHIGECFFFAVIYFHEQGYVDLEKEHELLNPVIKIVLKITEVLNMALGKIPGIPENPQIPPVVISDGITGIVMQILKTAFPTLNVADKAVKVANRLGIRTPDLKSMLGEFLKDNVLGRQRK